MPSAEAEVQRILAAITDEAEQIEAIANVRGYFMPNDEDRTHTIKSYLAGILDVPAAIDLLASPIEESHTTADYGRALWQAELVSRNQRTFFTDPQRAAEQWGEPVSLAEPDPEAGLPSTEGNLWDLYYGILIEARKIPWSNAS